MLKVLNSSPNPPPLPGETPFFLAINGEREGPFELAIIKQKIQNGEIARNTLVWQDPMLEWLAAEKLDKLAAYFPKMPPPVPPV